MSLDGPQKRELREALIKTLPDVKALEMFLMDYLGKKLDTLVARELPIDRTVFDLIHDWAEPENKLGDLIEQLHRYNPVHIRDFINKNLIKLLEIMDWNADHIPQEFRTKLLMMIVQQVERSMSLDLLIEAGLIVLPDHVNVDCHEAIKALEQFELPIYYRLYILLILIKEYPRDPLENHPTFLNFVNVLYTKSAPGSFKISLRNWAEALHRNNPLLFSLDWFLGSDSPGQTWLSRFDPRLMSAAQAARRLEAYLMITVKRQDSKTCRLNAFLQHAELDEPLPIVDLAKDQLETGQCCLFKDLPEQVIRLIQLGERKLSKETERLKYGRGALTLEFFLPYEHLGLAVDIWKIPVLGKPEPIGSQYGVILRSYDRFTPDHSNLKSGLNDSWERLQNLLNQTLSQQEWHDQFQHLEQPQSRWQEIIPDLKEKIGVKLTCGLPRDEDEQAELFRSILLADIPFAIWTRCHPLPNLLETVNQFLKIDYFRDFSECLKYLEKVRTQASVLTTPADHPGHHLALLYDDPNRPLPLFPLTEY
jgi:vWA-MoxR associated protein C-terminal domain/Effector-associated domain 1